MTPQMLRRLQAESGAGVNVWSKVPSAVASIDFLKSPGRMDEVLSAGWDLVLIDEAHPSTDAPQRGSLASAVWNAPSVGIAVATTGLPHEPAWLADDARTITVHWKLADLIGRRILPQRHVHTVHYVRSESERQIVDRIQGLLGNAPRDHRSQFTVNLLLRRLESSLYAFEQTLRRLLTAETFGDTELNDWSLDDLEEDADSTAAANSFRIDRQAGEEILALLESEPTDSKWDCCCQLLTSRGIGKTCSGILFTEFADTAEYLQYLAKSRELNVFLITGSVGAEARYQALQSLRQNPALLIATQAVEGMTFPFIDQVIHYDLPWNPRAFLQRIGSMERLGNPAAAFENFFIREQDAGSTVLARLLEKVAAIENEWK